jgi:hypothetical protein
VEKKFELIELQNIYSLHIWGMDRKFTETQVRKWLDSKNSEKEKFKKADNLGKLGVEGCEIRIVENRGGNCYQTATYELKTPKELSEDELEGMRQQYDFLKGQVTANVKCVKKEGSSYIYTLFSECDSGD